MMQHAGPILWPITSLGCVLCAEKVHAMRFKADVTVCGVYARHVTPVARLASPGLGAVVSQWPPYRSTDEGWVRCPACWEQTGKPRPSLSWRDV